MNSIQRSEESELLAELRARYASWQEMEKRCPKKRAQVRAELRRDFNKICGYCERRCEPITKAHSAGEESVDHFQPKKRFPELSLDWRNLIYACRRCNQAKERNWPGYDDEGVNEFLTAGSPRYVPVSELVSPNTVDGQRPACDFFEFNVKTGEISPRAQLDPAEWSKARRTIRDIDLNDSDVGENDEGNLWVYRLRHLTWLTEKLDKSQDFDEKVNMMLESMQPGKPFSGFIAAYFMDRFPGLAQLRTP